MRRHEVYKSIKNNWLINIPKHWELKKLKYLVYHSTEKSSQNSAYKVALENIESETGKYIEVESGGFEGDSKSFTRGDILFNKLRPYLAKVLLAERPGICVAELLVFRPLKEIHSGFLFYLLISRNFIEIVNSSTYGSKMPRASVHFILDQFIPFPPQKEQLLISSFLDRKTTLIDDLISKTQRKVDILNEQRTSIINRAVTKGLNSSEKMKYCGVEWIGEIPVKWEFSKIKYHFSFTGGGTPSREQGEYWGGDIPWISPKDMKAYEISNSQEKITKQGLMNSTTNLVEENSLLIVIRSGILQRTIPIGINSVQVAINQDLKALRPLNNDQIKFLFYFIKGNEANLLKKWSKEGTTVESIEMEFMINSKIPIPPVFEQIQIVEYLDKINQKIDDQITLERKRIELLQEYRKSLISEVVAGKIDIRLSETMAELK